MKTSNRPTIILAIESSCDETACAVVQKAQDQALATVLSSVTATSLAKHKATRGIVPEVAAREQLKFILPVIQEALQQFGGDKTDIEAIAVTVGPGLVGSLLVGIETARALAMAWDKPMIPVNHIEAHPYANFVDFGEIPYGLAPDSHQALRDDVITNFPLLSWVISGGHTELYLMNSHEEITHLGGTVDDAAGECFDKCARVLGFDYPGGPFIEKLAEQFDVAKHPLIKLPRPLIHEKNFLLSFSGLKTAFLRAFREHEHTIDSVDLKISLAYELQEAITDIILKKTQLALEMYPDVKSIIISGGVAANKGLRKKLETAKLDKSENQPALNATHSVAGEPTIHFPPLSLCTDNAAMIGTYAAFHTEKVTSWKNVTLRL